MVKYNVTPLKGFNDVQFGMSRTEIHRILGEPIRAFKKSQFSKVTTDDYSNYHIFYDKNDCFEAVEFFEATEVADLKNSTIFDVFETLKNPAYNFFQDGDGYLDIDLSIGVYAPDNSIESILFAVKDYYK